MYRFLVPCSVALVLQCRAHQPSVCSGSLCSSEPGSSLLQRSSVRLSAVKRAVLESSLVESGSSPGQTNASDESASAVAPSQADTDAGPSIAAGQQSRSNVTLPDESAKWPRPHQGLGPEIVEFGLRLQKLHGLDFSRRSFMANLTLTLRWNDTRTKMLLPDPAASLLLTAAEASKVMWLPGVGVNHPDVANFEEVSSMVSLRRDGTVQQSTDTVTKLALNFKTDHFPFDIQSVGFQVTPLMSSVKELMLVPLNDATLSGVEENVFSTSSMRLLSSNAKASTAGEGMSLSSVGDVDIKIRRDTGPVIRQTILPSVSTTLVSCSVFFVPLTSAIYILPRAAVSFITVSLQLRLADEIDKIRPAEGGLTWLDVFYESNTILTLTGAGLNAFVLAARFFGGHGVLASLFNHELRFLLPLLTIILHVICAFCIGYEFPLPLVLITRAVLAASVASYLGGCATRWQSCYTK